MPKFIVRATEEVFYTAIMEADSLDELRKKLAQGSFDYKEFLADDMGGQFNIDSIEESKDA